MDQFFGHRSGETALDSPFTCGVIFDYCSPADWPWFSRPPIRVSLV